MQVERIGKGKKFLAGADGKKLLKASQGAGVLVLVSGGRVSNTWVICPVVGNNRSKGRLIPHKILARELG